jgi:peptidyl-prolyl cis-trans isomerase A (cyclophilin A)
VAPSAAPLTSCQGIVQSRIYFTRVDQNSEQGQFCRVLRRILLPLLLVTPLTASVLAGPPIARFQSVLGDFDVLLDPSAAPISVTNFASYANRGAYDSTIIHRSTTYNPASIQIVQGGGFALVGNNIDQVPPDPPIPLEAGVANTRGTIAMARTADPDSATSQWYFNVTDNPGLDFNYAVFGRVLGAGQNVIDAIGAVTVYNASTDLGPAFGELPLFGPALTVQNLVLINAVRVGNFAITNVTRNAAAVEIRWTPLSTNTPVRVERTTDLAGEPWTTIASNTTTGVFIDTTAPTRGAYYRVVAE